MKAVARNLRYWVSGLVLALCGLLVARKIGPTFAGKEQIFIVVAGQLLAFGGLIVICAGVSRRLKREGRGGTGQ
jgi:hypothetical protein